MTKPSKLARESRRFAHRILSFLPPLGLARDKFAFSVRHPDWAYAYFDRYFKSLPEEVRRHRHYFESDMRGFGERAFHSMWNLIFSKFSIRQFLEIGVYRGQVLSLAALLQRRNGIPEAVTGISPMDQTGDLVSQYMNCDYETDIRRNFTKFGLRPPTLVKASSTDPLALQVIQSRQWDCIYVDGSHDYEIVQADWSHCFAALSPGGIIVLDDAGLETRFAALRHGHRGHPGPSRLAAEIMKTNNCHFLMQVGHNLVFQKPKA